MKPRRAASQSDGSGIIPLHGPRYATVEQFLGAVRKECETVRQEIHTEWQLYRAQYETIARFKVSTLPQLKKHIAALIKLSEGKGRKVTPEERNTMVIGHAVQAVQLLTDLQARHPEYISQLRFNPIMKCMQTLQRYGMHSKDNTAIQYLSGSTCQRHLNDILKAPEQPQDDPALAFIPKKAWKGKQRKDFLWKPRGLDDMFAKFVVIHSHSVKKHGVQPMQGSAPQAKLWLTSEMVAVMHKHCLDDNPTHPFYAAITRAGVNCGQRMLPVTNQNKLAM